ncbi:MAG: ribonuclease P protein component [Thermodesulfobacteriota bacterium]
MPGVAGGELAGHRLPKGALIRRPGDYRAIYRYGRRIRGRNFNLIFRPNGRGYNRLGISIHGLKLAVQRNRVKRLIKEFFRGNRNFLPAGHDIVFASRREFRPASPAEVKTLIQQAIKGSEPPPAKETVA